MAIALFLQAIQALAGSQFVTDKLKRNEHVIRVLQQVGLDPEHPPEDFEGIYAYAIVEYGIGKPAVCLEIFRSAEIRQGFRQCFDGNDPQGWLKQAGVYVRQEGLEQRVIDAGCEVQRELAEFAAAFLRMAKRSQTPKEVLESQKLSRVDRNVKQIAEQIAVIANHPVLMGDGVMGLGRDGVRAIASAGCRAGELALQMREWFEVLGYRLEGTEKWEVDHFEWVINIPKRRGFDRVLVRGIAGEAGVRDVMALREAVTGARTDEGWLVTARRISQAARSVCETSENEDLFCFTLDEFLDQDADFDGYLEWLEREIVDRNLEARYVPLACTKEEFDPVTHQRLGMSRYGDGDGWTEGYIDLWLDDPAKEHLSILGEFGTGKTWLTLHYALGAVRSYQEAKRRGAARPRLPIVIPLRDYAKAVSVESLFSEFFFRKHEIPIPGYSAFEQLNRMGKLLLIFDGFDEMAARVDKQQMINNFWELAKVVVPGSKVILTCRTEHFPDAKEGRSLLNAELQASTRGLSGETPQFEVLELEKFDDSQIREVLLLASSSEAVEQVMGNPQLLDLARRPVMTELILEALPEIEAGKPVDMSRVYLYAVRRKMERDIKAERTFTSMADKLYFLCELSWEMLSNDRMSLNYREFPDRIRKLFGSAVQEEKDLDHWHYDMMGQTMLIRNSDGDYTPAHRSLLEFFVAFKFAAELGALATDFLELAQMKSGIDRSLEPRDYTWSEYFGGGAIAPLKGFVTEKLEVLRSGFGKEILSKAVLELLVPSTKNSALSSILGLLIKRTKNLPSHEVQAVNGNMITLFSQLTGNVLSMYNFSQIFIQGADFKNSRLQNCNFQNSVFMHCRFTRILGKVSTLAFSPDGKLLATGDSSNAIRLWNIQTGQEMQNLQGHASWGYSVAFSPDGYRLVSGSYDGKVKIWSLADGKCINTLNGHTDWVRSVTFSHDGHYIASASSEILIWNAESGELIQQLKGHRSWVYSVCFHPGKNELVSGSYDKTVRVWDLESGQSTMTLNGHQGSIQSVAFNSSGNTIISAGEVVKLWDYATGTCLCSLEGHQQEIWSAQFSPKEDLIVTSSSDRTIKIWDVQSKRCIKTLQGHTDRVYAVQFHPSGELLASGSHDATIRFWDVASGEMTNIIEGHSDGIISLKFSNDYKYLAIGCSDKSARIVAWTDQDNCSSAQFSHTYKVAAGGGWVQSATFSPDQSFFVSAGLRINIWDAQHHTLVKSITDGHTLTLWTEFNSEGNLLVSCGDEAQIRLWDFDTYQCLKIMKGHTNRIWKVKFTYDDKFIISCSSDETIRIWRVDTGECISIRFGHRKRIYTLDTHPFLGIFASGGDDELLRIWNLVDQNHILELSGHEGAIVALNFSLDGNWIASSSGDNKIRIWNTFTGECIRIIVADTNTSINELVFHPNNILVSGSTDGALMFWDTSSGKCLRTLRNRPYEGMNITGVKGLTPATIATLKALGAVEDEELRGENVE